MLIHNIQKVQRTRNIIVIITQGHSYRFADRLESGKVYNRVKIIFFKNLFGCGIVQKVNLIELKILAANLFNPVHRLHAAVVKVVENSNFIAVIQKLDTGMASYISCTARNQYFHNRILSFSELGCIFILRIFESITYITTHGRICQSRRILYF